MTQTQAATATQGAGQPKILRIGVIQSGRIIEEKLIRERRTVTIGQSTRNTFTLFSPALPSSLPMFEVIGGRYVLNFTDDMDGRLAVGDRVLPLLQVMEEGIAKQRGQFWQVALSESSRGKVIIGEVTLLFQFVTPPPPRPRPKLPASVRGGFFQNMDWTFATCFLAVIVFQTGFLVYIRSVDWPKEVEIDKVPDRFAKYIVPAKPVVQEKPKAEEPGAAAKKEPEEKKEVAKKSGGEDGGKKGKKEVDPAEAARRAEAAARAEAERRARLAEQVSRMGALKILGGKGTSSSAVADLVARGDPGTDADKAFAGVGGVGVATAGTGGGLLKGGGGGSGKVVGIGDLKGTSGVETVGTGEKGEEKTVKGIVKEETPEVDGTLDQSVVSKEIGRKRGAVQDCYERALKRDPSLGGKIAVRFTIGPTGAVTAVEIEDDTIGDAEVAECVKSVFKRARFPAPEGGSVEVGAAFVLTASQ